MVLEAPAWLQMQPYPAALDRLVIDSAFQPGVVDGHTVRPAQPLHTGPGLNVTAHPSTRSVIVAPGVASIAGSDMARQGSYLCRATSATTIDIDTGTTGLERRDLIYAQVRDSTAGGTPGVDDWRIDKVVGVPAATNPAVPPTPPSAIPLAWVRVVGPGTGPFAAADIVNLRQRATTLLPGPTWQTPRFGQALGTLQTNVTNRAAVQGMVIPASGAGTTWWAELTYRGMVMPSAPGNNYEIVIQRTAPGAAANISRHRVPLPHTWLNVQLSTIEGPVPGGESRTYAVQWNRTDGVGTISSGAPNGAQDLLFYTQHVIA